jgi:hypothetical protein
MSIEKSIIGYFAFTRNGHVACDGTACLVAGSYKSMKHFLAKSHPLQAANHKILKTTYGEIRTGMKMGAAYAFDAQSYARLKTLAHADGIDLPDANFLPEHPGEIKLMTISRRFGW